MRGFSRPPMALLGCSAAPVVIALRSVVGFRFGPAVARNRLDPARFRGRTLRGFRTALFPGSFFFFVPLGVLRHVLEPPRQLLRPVLWADQGAVRPLVDGVPVADGALA